MSFGKWLMTSGLSLILLGTVLGVYGYITSNNSDQRYNKYWIIADTKAEEMLPNGTYVWHDPIDEAFATRTGYWNLTDPDPYVLEAIQNPGRAVIVSHDAPGLTIVKQLEEHNWEPTVKYNGKYYLLNVIGTPMNPWR